MLKVAEGYINEDNFTVWSDLTMNLSVVSNMIQYTDAADNYKQFVRDLYGPVAKNLGWEAKSDEGNYVIGIVNPVIFVIF